MRSNNEKVEEVCAWRECMNVFSGGGLIIFNEASCGGKGQNTGVGIWEPGVGTGR